MRAPPALIFLPLLLSNSLHAQASRGEARYPAVPIKPESWMTADDYPMSAIRDMRTGRTGVKVHINLQGVVTSCSVAQSSGFADLDQASCAIMLRSAHYKPARDRKRRPVETDQLEGLRWVIPVEGPKKH